MCMILTHLSHDMHNLVSSCSCNMTWRLIDFFTDIFAYDRENITYQYMVHAIALMDHVVLLVIVHSLYSSLLIHVSAPKKNYEILLLYFSFDTVIKYTTPVWIGYKTDVNEQCAEESSAVMKPSLPQYTPLVSGVSVSGTVPCTAFGPLSYTYFTLPGQIKSSLHSKHNIAWPSISQLLIDFITSFHATSIPLFDCFLSFSFLFYSFLCLSFPYLTLFFFST